MKRFTHDWFSHNIKFWEVILDTTNPSRILEIGSFEGMSTCYLIDKLAQHRALEIYCLDSWEGGIEHIGFDMKMHERNFHYNTNHSIRCAPYPVRINKRKGNSLVELSKLVVESVEPFDLVYIDGSHKTADVFVDAALSFNLLRVGGVMIFDDYKYSPNENSSFEQEQFEHPKNAIDSFALCFGNKLTQTHFQVDGVDVEQDSLYQIYLKKIAP